MFRPIETDKMIVLVNVAYKVLVLKVISTTVLRFAKIPTSLLKAQTFVFFFSQEQIIWAMLFT